MFCVLIFFFSNTKAVIFLYKQIPVEHSMKSLNWDDQQLHKYQQNDELQMIEHKKTTTYAKGIPNLGTWTKMFKNLRHMAKAILDLCMTIQAITDKEHFRDK